MSLLGHLFLIESSRTNTISPAWKFRFGQFHFWQDYRVAKVSFFHRVQNSLHTCWTHRQYFRQYISSFWNIPGGSVTIFIFMLSNCIGLSDIGLLIITSNKFWTDYSFNFNQSVLNDSSLRLSPFCFSRAARMLLADLICRSVTPPILLGVGELCPQINHSLPSSIKKSLIFFLSISLNALCCHCCFG